MLENISVSPGPHTSQPHSTRSIMFDVIIALAFPVIAAAYYFRTRALILITVCIIASVLTEWLCNLIRKKPNSVDDLSAVVTGIILALSVPPHLPWWAAIIGSAFAIAIGKMVFGGLGSNTFNPAMVGRAFITACFGILMTTWAVPATINPDMPKLSAAQPQAITQATPLAWSKQAIKTSNLEDKSKIISANVVNKMLPDMFYGKIGGCLGETSVLALLIGGAYLLIKRTITFHIPLAVLASTFVFAGIGYVLNPAAYASPLVHLSSGGMLLCAFFIATDPVTAPLTKKGMWIFGIGTGALIMLIRMVGEYPEGIMYAILLMNAVTPLIDRFVKLIPAGGKPNVS